MVWMDNVPKQELDLIEFATCEMTSLVHVRRRSCGASFSIPARDAASRTTSHGTFGVILLPQTRPALLIDRKSTPSVMPLASFQVSTASFTHPGMGMVRTCPALPKRSAMTPSALHAVGCVRRTVVACGIEW